MEDIANKVDKPSPTPEAGAAAEPASPPVQPWAEATAEDLKNLDFESPIAALKTGECFEISSTYEQLLKTNPEPPLSEAAKRVYLTLASVTGMHFRSDSRTEPYGPMLVFEGRRSAILSDFRATANSVIAAMGRAAVNPALKARLCDVAWLLDRKQHELGTLAVDAYLEIVRKVDAGELKLLHVDETGALNNAASDLLQRALMICLSLGRDKPQMGIAKDLCRALREKALASGNIAPVIFYSDLDLDFAATDAAKVAADTEDLLAKLPKGADPNTIEDLWRMAIRAYGAAKDDAGIRRWQQQSGEQAVREDGVKFDDLAARVKAEVPGE